MSMDDQLLKELQQVHTLQKMWGIEVFTYIEDLAFKKLAEDYHICNENCQLINMLEDLFNYESHVTISMMLAEAKRRGIMEEGYEEH